MKIPLAWLALVAAAATSTFAHDHGAHRASTASGKCHEDALVVAGNARFCVLSAHVVRMEWAATTAGFRDATTIVAQNRRVEPLPEFKVTHDGTSILIQTQSLRVEYDTHSNESFSDANLKVTLLQHASWLADDARTWLPSMTDAVQSDALPGTIRTLDGADGAVPLDCHAQGPSYIRDKHCTYGVMSRKRGYTVLDDSLSAPFDADPFWPWLASPIVTAAVDPATCARVVASDKRRICGLDIVAADTCAAKGCCFAASPASSPSLIPGQRLSPSDAVGTDAFQCFYGPSSYQDLYFFGHGHDFRAALRDFTALSGSIPIPPRFAFGVFYSRWWAYSDADLQHDVVNQYEDRSLPLDVLVIDMDWHLTFYKNGGTDQAGQTKGWTGLTWDNHLFPDPQQFLTWLHEKGIAVTLNLHPASGVQPWEDSYSKVATAMGIDPKSQQYVPFRITNKSFAETWLNISIGAREADGVDFWWLDWQQGEDWIDRVEGRSDMNPTLWLNYVFSTNPHHWGGSAVSSTKTHARPMLLHRFGGLGNHRYPVGFSGDSFATWATLGFQPHFTTMAANVAYGYWSHDLGGFQNPPGAELFTRWIQWGAFAPVFRTHSSKDASSDRRIWKYGDVYYAITRAAMVLRASLIPYVYSEAARAHVDGVSVLHGVFIDYPEHDEAYSYTQQYMYGSQLLVSPVVEPVANDTQLSAKSIWLPPGDWYDFNTGNVVTGPIVLSYSYALHEIPRFAKAGAIIPTAPHDAAMGGSSVGQNVQAPTALHVLVVPGASKHYYELVEDDGVSNAYLAGHQASTLFEFQTTCTANRRERVFQFGTTNLAAIASTSTKSPAAYCSGGLVAFDIQPVKGSYSGMPTERSYTIELLGALPAASVTVNGEHLDAIEFADTAAANHIEGFSYAGETLSLVIHLNKPRSVATLQHIVVQFIATPSASSSDDVDVAATLVSTGLVGKFARLHTVKVLLDNQWHTDTVFMSDYPNLLAASEIDRRISYNASNIVATLADFDALYAAGVKEVAALTELHADVKQQALALLSTKSFQTERVRYMRSPIG